MKLDLRTIVALILAGLSGTFLLYTSQSVQKTERDLRLAKKQIAQESEMLRVLEAEWAFLSAPSRVEILANDLLQDYDDNTDVPKVTFTIKSSEPKLHQNVSATVQGEQP